MLWGIADEDEGKLHDNTILTVKHNHGEKYTIMSENKNKQKTATGWESSGKMISTCFSKSGNSEVEIWWVGFLNQSEWQDRFKPHYIEVIPPRLAWTTDFTAETFQMARTCRICIDMWLTVTTKTFVKNEWNTDSHWSINVKRIIKKMLSSDRWTSDSHSAGMSFHLKDCVMLKADTHINTWAPSQYKDRLMYVWRFPC